MPISQSDNVSHNAAGGQTVGVVTLLSVPLCRVGEVLREVVSEHRLELLALTFVLLPGCFVIVGYSYVDYTINTVIL